MQMKDRTKLPFGTPVVGVLGAGQLARMMYESAISLGIAFRVFANDENESAAQVCADKTLGNLQDIESVLKFARSVDVITLDHELVPSETLESLVQNGIKVFPSPAAVQYAANKGLMRQELAKLEYPMPKWLLAENLEQARNFFTKFGSKIIAKSPTGGYDGRGVWGINTESELESLIFPVLLEEKVKFVRELSAVVVRSTHNQAVSYPVVETIQSNGICTQVIAPALDLDAERAGAAQAMALRIADDLDVVGVLAVELFDSGSGELLVNELAMRPHNSAHWTQDGSVTSQFENHLRAVLDLPLGSPEMVSQFAVMGNIIGGQHEDLHRGLLHCLARDPKLHIHLYGKEVREGRKVGHVNAIGDNLEDLIFRVTHAVDFLAGTIDE